MADVPFSGSPDTQTIDIDNDESIRSWAKALGVTRVQVIDAVAKVGPRPDDVRQHLDQQMAAGQADA